jgi:hypothetical protein
VAHFIANHNKSNFLHSLTYLLGRNTCYRQNVELILQSHHSEQFKNLNVFLGLYYKKYRLVMYRLCSKLEFFQARSSFPVNYESAMFYSTGPWTTDISHVICNFMSFSFSMAQPNRPLQKGTIVNTIKLGFTVFSCFACGR